jgi:hypothetical protein
LDGDQDLRGLSKNFCILPGNGNSPEKVFFHFLKSLSDSDKFWSQDIGGYRRQVCFEEYMSVEPVKREQFKSWFNSQEKYWGKNARKLLNRWMIDNTTGVTTFQAKFVKAFEYVKKKTE